MTEWDIQSRADTCAACQRPFADKEVYHTLLRMDANGYQRRDLCGACYANASRDGVLSYWQGEYKLPAPPPPEPIQRETAETLLRKLVESTDPAHAAARYILAVMLERKRILKHRDTVREKDGNELLVYEHARTGESFTIPDPHLRLEQLAQVQQEIAAVLHPTPESAEAEPATELSPGN
ncbi:MAG TPA: hypothetical protein VL486_01855 [Verrucomicrobiae bacterium]|nr:hypothetical protein [Verrucomicrobiae bacterium]